MQINQQKWSLPVTSNIPPDWYQIAINIIRTTNPKIKNGHYLAQLLWQRNNRDLDQLAGWLDANAYNPCPPTAFGQEMIFATNRLVKACETGEKVAIWGDFDTDGITATALLWEALHPVFSDRLFYHIPSRLRESHGLNIGGIEKLANHGVTLIITCDNGSTNELEVIRAKKLNIDIIITDHHTLPNHRPPVTAIINPRYLPIDHPLYHLAGVGVAYKLMESFYNALPSLAEKSTDNLLELVAIGLIADLVNLSGDSRYLAQRGLERIAQNKYQRLGLKKLLKLCNKQGDRPFDISFGIAPRINSMSRINDDVGSLLTLLTSQEEKICQQIAHDAEIINLKRKQLQDTVTKDIIKKVESIDFSTNQIIVLVNHNWSIGILGLVAGNIARTYGKPTILLTTENNDQGIAKGSARWVNNIDLYQLIKSQQHLLTNFGGHPFAAGLSLPIENLPVFIEGLNQEIRCQNLDLNTPLITADLCLKIANLTPDLFYELKQLEPCGINNPSPKILLRDVEFKYIKSKEIPNQIDSQNKYKLTEFQLIDSSNNQGISGISWEVISSQIPSIPCDVIGELEWNSYKEKLIFRLSHFQPSINSPDRLITPVPTLEIIDYRHRPNLDNLLMDDSTIYITECPRSWSEFTNYCNQAIKQQKKLAIAYSPIQLYSPINTLHQLLGMVKYASNHQTNLSIDHLQKKLLLSDRAYQLFLQILTTIGYEVWLTESKQELTINPHPHKKLFTNIADLPIVQKFIALIAEEQFYLDYFTEVSLYTLQIMSSQ